MREEARQEKREEERQEKRQDEDERGDRERERRQDQEETQYEKEDRREMMKKKREHERDNEEREREMKRSEFFQKNVSEPSNPPAELAQNVSKKNPFRTNYSSIFSEKVQNLTVFSIIYMIRIRFFGQRELIQNYFSGAR